MDGIKVIPLKNLMESEEAEEQNDGIVEIGSTDEESNSNSKDNQVNGNSKQCQIVLRKLTDLDEIRRAHNLAEIRNEKVSEEKKHLFFSNLYFSFHRVKSFQIIQMQMNPKMTPAKRL